jgi:hypothetical protein
MFPAFERHSRTLAHNGVLFLDGWFAVRRGFLTTTAFYPSTPARGAGTRSGSSASASTGR